MQIQQKKVLTKVTLNNTALKETKQYKYLSLIITNKLSWAAHIEKVV